jgi:hypothetical protein
MEGDIHAWGVSLSPAIHAKLFRFLRTRITLRWDVFMFFFSGLQDLYTLELFSAKDCVGSQSLEGTCFLSPACCQEYIYHIINVCYSEVA